MTCHTGKSVNSLGNLCTVQEKKFKRQRVDGSDKTRAEFAHDSMLSSRQRRSMKRGWGKREARLRRAFDKRGSYLGNRIDELTSSLASNVQHIKRIEGALAARDLDSLLVPLPPPEEGYEDGEDWWVEGEEDEWKETISDAQASRVGYQGWSALQVLKEEHTRDQQQLQLTVEAKALSDLDLPTKDAVEKADARRFALLDEASRIRHESSLLRIGANVLAAGTRGCAVSTILAWVRDFRKLGGFKRDARGVHERDWIMSEEDLQHELLTWMRKQGRPTVKKVRDYINGFLSRLLAYQVTLPVSMSTTLAWMKALGCKYKRADKSYYTDTHEKEAVVKDRGGYVEKKRKYALRQAVWVRVRRASLTPEERKRLDDIKAEGPEGNPTAEVYDCLVDGHACVEFHVDFLRDGGSVENFDALREKLGPEGGHYSVRFNDAAAAPCEEFHPPDECKCNRKVRHTGQDESCYKAYAREGNEWVTRGVSGLRKKTEGPGEMVSAFQDERRGFGLPISDTVLEKVNTSREKQGKTLLTRSPGKRFLDYGKNKNGYWNYEMFKDQVEDVLDVLEHLEPDMQVVMEIDHSSGHAKQREDGLHVTNINVKFGGKQRVLRDSVMTDGCLGPEEAKMYLANGEWSTELSEGAVCVDQKLKIGDTQTSTFAVGAPPPIYDWQAPRKDTKVVPKGKKTKTGTGDGDGAGVSPDAASSEAAAPKTKERIKEGYEGKAKGGKQYLWERGWWKEGMSAAATVSDEKNVELVLQALPDFKNERTALQHVVGSRGHILLLSPKCHPEVAGVGIEYSWGYSKQKFRRVYNDEKPKNLHANIEKSMCVEKHLTIGGCGALPDARATTAGLTACLL